MGPAGLVELRSCHSSHRFLPSIRSFYHPLPAAGEPPPRKLLPRELDGEIESIDKLQAALHTLLKALPTSAEEDEKILASGEEQAMAESFSTAPVQAAVASAWLALLLKIGERAKSESKSSPRGASSKKLLAPKLPTPDASLIGARPLLPFPPSRARLQQVTGGAGGLKQAPRELLLRAVCSLASFSVAY